MGFQRFFLVWAGSLKLSIHLLLLWLLSQILEPIMAQGSKSFPTPILVSKRLDVSIGATRYQQCVHEHVSFWQCDDQLAWAEVNDKQLLVKLWRLLYLLHTLTTPNVGFVQFIFEADTGSRFNPHLLERFPLRPICFLKAVLCWRIFSNL